jgi:MoxR-like ATPase
MMSRRETVPRMLLWNHYPLNFILKKACAMPIHIATRLIEAASRIILGKEEAVRLALACMLARGHLLMEDMPGVGKTTLAHALAHLLGLKFQRIQFTSDMLPADILGVSIFDQRDGAFRFHPGPVFSEMILADEINRATPKAQSALLEAMEERQISAEGHTYPLPAPFFVIATQNPADQIGTFPLPESQLDRFLMRISLGYPDPTSERALLAGEDRREMLARLPPVLAAGELDTLLAASRRIHVGPRLLDYVQALLARSRESTDFSTGLSPRAGLALLSAARAWALLAGRDHVLPEDVQAVLPAVAGHRLRPAGETPVRPDELSRRLREAVPLP